MGTSEAEDARCSKVNCSALTLFFLSSVLMGFFSAMCIFFPHVESLSTDRGNEHMTLPQADRGKKERT